ncbi:MAG: hypothetical protein IIY57_02455, partial [Erysipelotrichaceae bacterium]|nr:hypothetical protein [Erysipelotrichaceae bacterium]
NRTYKGEDLIEDVDNVGLLIEVLSNNIDTSRPGDLPSPIRYLLLTARNTLKRPLSSVSETMMPLS